MIVEQEQTQIPAQDGPYGHIEVKLDDKGRIRLPPRFKNHLSLRFPNERLFITSMDLARGRLYPISVWKQNLEILENVEGDEDGERAEQVVFRANKYGLDQAVDDQGRIMVPPKLRDLLGIGPGGGEDGQRVWLQWSNDGIDIFNKKEYDRLSGESDQPRADEKKFLKRLKVK
jgi:DNA-binding transcriptional regulator/RsmH inhibitor MraZ